MTNADDFETSRALLVEEASRADCDNLFPRIVGGECVDQGLLFLSRSTGFAMNIRYFNANTGRLVAAAAADDLIDPVCFGRRFAPFPVRCTEVRVTEVLCGGRSGSDR